MRNEWDGVRAMVAQGKERTDANRASLLTGVTKSVADVDALLKRLEEDRKLRRFIGTKSDANRAAPLAEPKVAATIPGVSIEGGDDAFFVKPLAVSATWVPRLRKSAIAS